MVDAVILKPIVLGPSQGGIKLPRYSYNAGLWEDQHPLKVGARGWTTAPKMTFLPALKQPNPIFHGQCPSASPGHPEGTRLHFYLCCHTPWEPDQAATAGGLEGSLVGRAPEIWKGLLAVHCDGIQFQCGGSSYI